MLSSHDDVFKYFFSPLHLFALPTSAAVYGQQRANKIFGDDVFLAEACNRIPDIFPTIDEMNEMIEARVEINQNSL